MGRDIVKAKLDVIFKKLFTTDIDVLKGFLSDILEIPKEEIKSIEILNPNNLPDEADGKQSQLDLKMRVDDKIINVEIQLKKTDDFKDRALYYWAKMYSDELKRGDEYKKLKHTIAINIVDFDLFTGCPDFCSTFTMMEKNRYEMLTDKCTVIFLELVKRKKKVDRHDRKMLWVQLIDAETEEELNMLNETGVPEIQKAVMILHEMSEDEKTKEMARMREKKIRDDESLFRTGVNEGIEKGMKKGIEKGIKEGIKEGRKEGIKEGQEGVIAKMRKFGLSEEEIKKILNS